MYKDENLSLLLKKVKNLHFIGVGGVSMSALADIMRIRGYNVTGSDMSASPTTAKLAGGGIKIFIGHEAQNVRGAELIIYTAAVKADNPELIEGEALGIPSVERAVFLGAIMQKFKQPIAISGTHGKTTTTSMAAVTTIAGGLDPTVMIGGTLPDIDGNYRLGAGVSFIFEACEYVDSFLNFHPKVAVILNIEADHLDYFSGIEQIIGSFKKFANLCGEDGLVIANYDDENTRTATDEILPKVVYFGMDKRAKYFADNLSVLGFPSFDFYIEGELQKRISLKVPGKHNVLNSLATLALCNELNLDMAKCFYALENFSGVCRRFEKKGEFCGADIIDDYAHHPSEIETTLKSARQMGYKKIICIFQPHTYTRTKALFEEFTSSLSFADVPIIVDIYSAREKDDGSISSEALSSAIPGAIYCPSLPDAAEYAKKIAEPGDVIFTMGAGNVSLTTNYILD